MIKLLNVFVLTIIIVFTNSITFNKCKNDYYYSSSMLHLTENDVASFRTIWG